MSDIPYGETATYGSGGQGLKTKHKLLALEGVVLSK